MAITLSLCGTGATLAQSYPSRPIQLIVPLSAGSSIDILARGFAEGLSAELGQPTVVVNRDGASGTIAFAALANALPDGYTLAFSPQGVLTIQPHLKPSLSYRFDSFQPICQVFEDAFAIIVGPSSPIADFSDLVGRARARPKALTFGTTGIATVPHLQVEGFAKAAGIELVHAPYRVTGQLVQDVLGGRLDFAVVGVASIRGANVRVLAVLDRARSPLYPDIPTVSELGYPVSMPGFGGLYAPKATPSAVSDRLEQGCSKAFASSWFQQVAKNAGAAPRLLARSAFAERLAEDSRDKKDLIKALNITAD